MPPVCILAGGRATRLGGLAEERPKALLEVAGRPFLLHQLDALAGAGVSRVVLCVGHLGDQIEAAVGPRYGNIAIDYSFDGPDLDGTLGAVRRAAPGLGPRFLVLYGDTYLRLDWRLFCSAWARSGQPAAMTTLRNDGRWDRSNVAYADGMIERYDKDRPAPGMRWIDYGLGGLTPEAVGAVAGTETDLAGLYRELAAQRRLFGFEVTDRFYEIGTPASLAETDAFLRHQGRETGP